MTNVDVSGLAKTYGEVSVLKDIEIRFPEGSFTSLLGPSGSGKTTLLRVIAGFIRPDRGRVTIGGNEVTHQPVWARNIGMVFQSYALFPHMTVADNVAFGLARRGIRGEQARREVDKALETVRLPGYAGRYPRELSGGQQQRVALARAIVIKPSVLLLDEPLSALDRRLRQEMQVELLRIQREIGLTTIFVTHDQEEALALSDNVAILNHGNIIQEGRPREIYERPRTRFAAQFLGDSNFLSGEATADGLRLGDGTLIKASGLQTPGAKATIAVRPEKMTIHPLDTAPEPGANLLPARIDAVIYSGPALTYLLSLADGTEIKLFAQNTDGRIRETGEEVALSWPAEHSVVLSD